VLIRIDHYRRFRSFERATSDRDDARGGARWVFTAR